MVITRRRFGVPDNGGCPPDPICTIESRIGHVTFTHAIGKQRPGVQPSRHHMSTVKPGSNDAWREHHFGPRIDIGQGQRFVARFRADADSGPNAVDLCHCGIDAFCNPDSCPSLSACPQCAPDDLALGVDYDACIVHRVAAQLGHSERQVDAVSAR